MLYLILGVFFCLFFASMLLSGQLEYNSALIPVAICGLISLVNMRECYKKSRCIYDVYLWIWFFMFISTFVAPLIHFCSGIWVEHMFTYPPSWYPYAFIIAISYLCVIILWTIMLRPRSISPLTLNSKVWSFKKNSNRFLILVMLCSFVSQVYIYYSYGGIWGYMQAFTESSLYETQFSGMGVYFLLSDLFPSIFLIYIIKNMEGRKCKGLYVNIIILLVFLSALFFGGLRGSRSNVLILMSTALILIHLKLYRLKKIHWALYVLFFFLFMYVGRLYKDQGVQVFNEQERTMQIAVSELSPVESTIVGDFSRFGINTYQLYSLERKEDFKYKLGQTYLWGVLTFIPFGSSIIAIFDITSRTEASSELFYNGYYISSRILGPLGEWMINFGLHTFLIIYIILGVLFKRIRKFVCNLSFHDSRFYLIPSIITLLPQMIISDSSNVMYFFIKRILLLWIIIYIVSHKTEKS